MEAITVDEVSAAAERLLLMVEGRGAIAESNWSK
jgi:hypothetical protein